MALTAGAYLWPEHDRLVGVAAVVAVAARQPRRADPHRRRHQVPARRVVLVALAAVVVAGWSSPSASLGAHHTARHVAASASCASAGFLFFAFAGYARIATLGEEVRDPATTIPKAIPRRPRRRAGGLRRRRRHAARRRPRRCHRRLATPRSASSSSAVATRLARPPSSASAPASPRSACCSTSMPGRLPHRARDGPSTRAAGLVRRRSTTAARCPLRAELAVAAVVVVLTVAIDLARRDRLLRRHHPHLLRDHQRRLPDAAPGATPLAARARRRSASPAASSSPSRCPLAAIVTGAAVLARRRPRPPPDHPPRPPPVLNQIQGQTWPRNPRRTRPRAARRQGQRRRAISAHRSRKATAPRLAGANDAERSPLDAHPLDRRHARHCGDQQLRPLAAQRRPRPRGARCGAGRPSRGTAARSGGSSIAGEERRQLVERARRQRRRDRRHEQRVGGAEHALAGQRDARRAVEHGDVVVVGERRRAGRRAAGRASCRRGGGRGGAARSRPGATCSAGDVGRPDVRRRARRARDTSRSAPPFTDGLTRTKNVAAPCGSRSHSSTRAPVRAASKARLTAAVVLPTPPLML